MVTFNNDYCKFTVYVEGKMTIGDSNGSSCCCFLFIGGNHDGASMMIMAVIMFNIMTMMKMTKMIRKVIMMTMNITVPLRGNKNGKQQNNNEDNG